VSKNVRDDIIYYTGAETGNIKSVYSPEHAFYLLFYPSSSIVYCFDMRGTLEDGSNRVTTWPSTKIFCGTIASNGTVYLGTAKGINQYNDYLDDTSPYTMKYYTQPLAFGVAEYGIAEYNTSEAEYSASIIVEDAKVKSTGSGAVATIGVDATINGRSLSIQELKTEALIGKLV
jgi:hypothetical protein